MCDYESVAKSLQCCASDSEPCEHCNCELEECNPKTIMEIAADAIEELKFENEILSDGIDDLKAEVKRLEEVRDKALKRLCDWCGVCPEEKRDAMDCDDIARLGEVSDDA